ncbi:MAG: hypothetical protein GWM90_23880, partial [Gemmatimonadetes bacterium]|nr:hypothetical protein [Gemmatimonadota bacterium]NIQ57755.1 hypothetical protein [Gemmatimonadota bacterium]NIX47008.1 hypothetical protein [Gemmatimonadota bacterium]NIY11374.1 hypothetical protein [Gemmatimonadota bacterium]
GAAVRALPVLTLTADIRHALGENLDVGTRDHAGVGLEVSALPVLPVRAGIALISGGYRLAGGLGIRLGAFQLAAAATRRETDLGSDGGLALGATLGLP